MERYPLTITEGTLYSTALGLKFQAEEHYFTTNNRLELRCEAKIADLPSWKREKFIKPFYHSYSNQRPAPDSYRNNNGEFCTTYFDNLKFNGMMVIAIITETIFLRGCF